jgi:hypothetical protein
MRPVNFQVKLEFQKQPGVWPGKEQVSLRLSWAWLALRYKGTESKKTLTVVRLYNLQKNKNN